MSPRFVLASRAAATAAALLLSAGCATKHDVRDLSLELHALAQRQDSILAALARQNAVTQDTLRQQTNQLFEIRGDVARQLTRILDGLTQLRELTGQNQRAIVALREEIDELRRSGLAAAVGGAGGGVGTTGEAIVGVPPTTASDAEAMYKAAQEQLQNQQLGTAQRAFQLFIESYPNDARAPDARFYLADILDKQDKFKEAADAFSEIPSLYPDSPKVPEALYRIALLDLEHLNKKDEARRLLQRIVNSYGTSMAAGPARQKLREIR